MALFACREASVKPKHLYPGMRQHMLLAILISLLVSLTVICFGVLKPEPWADAQVVIPVSGMMLGSCVNALSLGMDRFLLSLRGSDGGGGGGGGRGGSPMLQMYLACGATRWEASLSSVRQAIETGLTPNLNQMSVMGLVSIPGMFTGQVLGGSSPLVAAKYQIVIIFFICSNSTSILFLTILQAIFTGTIFDGTNHIFRSKAVQKRKGGKPKDIVVATMANLLKVFHWLLDKTIPTNTNRGREQQQKQKQQQQQQKQLEQENTVKINTQSENRQGATDSKDDVEQNDPQRSSELFLPGTFQRVRDASSFQREGNPQTILKLTEGTIAYRDNSDSPSFVLTDLNLELRQGEILILKGPSGCGKSSLLRALAHLEAFENEDVDDADGATSEKNGTVLTLRGNSKLNPTEWRSEVIYVHQSGGQGISGTPMELLDDLLALKAQQTRRQQSGDTVDAVKQRFREHLEKLDLPSEMVDRRLDLLSGGEAQRVYLCLFLALRPTVLLLDEPTSACDEVSSRKVEDLVVTSPVSVVWISHDPNQIERLSLLEQTSVYSHQKTSQSSTSPSTTPADD